VEALGNAVLVLEDETTKLTLYNLDNPAGLGFLPPTTRVDLMMEYDTQDRWTQFTTGAPGSPGSITPQGTTLDAYTVYSRRWHTQQLLLDTWDNAHYGGLIAWVSPQVVFQVQPLGVIGSTTSLDPQTESSNNNRGARIASCVRLQPNFSLGAELVWQKKYTDFYSSWDWQPSNYELNQIPLGYNVQEHRDYYRITLGTAYRIDSWMDPKDQLDLGLRLRYAPEVRNQTLTSATPSPQLDLQWHSRPWEIEGEGIYSYQSVMNIGLTIRYEGAQSQFEKEDGINPSIEKTLQQSNLDYALSIRVLLPMVRENDLRFGVLFSNLGYGHPYPSGSVQIFDPTGSLPADIITVASGIGIGMAYVPEEGSVIALEYDLGSEKTREDKTIIADSGFTHFGLGAQYAIFPDLFLRLGLTSLHHSYESPIVLSDGSPSSLTNIQETNSIRLGAGWQEGSLKIDVTAIFDRTLNSPNGWTMRDKPISAYSVDQDMTQGIRGLVSVSWLY
jgi:hypothetical protein